MQNEDEFYAEKSRLLAEKEEAEKRTEELQAQTQELKLDTQFREAYTGAGGSGDSEAYEMVKRFLGDRMQVENGQPVFLDRDGLVELGEYGPKSLAEKMAELKRIPTFKGFFSGGADQTDSNQQPETKTYTREEVLGGKANINDIASGKAIVGDAGEYTKKTKHDHAKKINASELANLKSRNWSN
jgi:hypothetical protein